MKDYIVVTGEDTILRLLKRGVRPLTRSYMLMGPLE